LDGKLSVKGEGAASFLHGKEKEKVKSDPQFNPIGGKKGVKAD